MTDWISVEERLPEIHEEVLIFEPSIATDGTSLMDFHLAWRRPGGHWEESDGEQCRTYHPTHWMPVPEGPG